jgi:hypothetical protein
LVATRDPLLPAASPTTARAGSARFNPASSAQVNGPKSFVHAFPGVVGNYESGGASHLWTEVTRNAAGAAAEVKEPTTAVPAGYTGATGGATASVGSSRSAGIPVGSGVLPVPLL